MHSKIVEIIIDGKTTSYPVNTPPTNLIVRENQLIKIAIYISTGTEILDAPQLSIEDYSIQLHNSVIITENGHRVTAFSSLPEKIFRESFGSAALRLRIANEEFTFLFEVLATKVTALQVERMLHYLTERREHIIRVCLSRTTRPADINHDGKSDPEMVISTAEKIIETLLNCRGELKHHIRSKLIPAKVPAWKAEQSGNLIDPIDVIFNLDSLRPSDGRQDVLLRGRTYSTSAIDVTALVKDTNIEENQILIGGLYSIFRVISGLMDEINTAFKGRQIAAYDKEYISIGEVLIKFAGGAMYKRCEKIISSTESLIRMMENEFKIKFIEEIRPRITPYVRSSRLYRNIFEKYTHWYNLSSPTISGNLYLIKIRSVSKIFEFYTLFRIFDHMLNEHWGVTDFSLNKEFDNLIPKTIIFKKNQLQATLAYEPLINLYSNKTLHMDLVKIYHPKHSGGYWTPDYTLCIKDGPSNKIRYIILDAKYSNPYHVKKEHLPEIFHKYYELTGVFNKSTSLITKNEIMGIFAIFPESQEVKIIRTQLTKFCVDDDGPFIIPMVNGFSISLQENDLIGGWLSKAIKIASTDMMEFDA